MLTVFLPSQAAHVGNQAEPPLGLTTSEFTTLRELSRGTQSIVYEGKYRDQHVAVKKAKIGKSADLDSFKLEIAVMAKLRHVSSVVSLVAARLVPPGASPPACAHVATRATGLLFQSPPLAMYNLAKAVCLAGYLLVMPYIPENLYTKIHHDGWRPGWPAVLHLSTKLAEGVAAVHQAGILHRDLKPGNVLLDQEGLPHICDFGIAMPVADLHVDDAGGSTKGKPSGGFHKHNMMGTLEYMAPETLQKQLPSQKSDMWALAVMLNEVATGTFPFSDCTQENPAAHTVLEMGYGRCVDDSSSATPETAYLKASESILTATRKHCQE